MVNTRNWWKNVVKNEGSTIGLVVWLTVIPVLVLMQASNSTREFVQANWAWIVVYLGVMCGLNGVWRKVMAWVSVVVIEPPVLVELGWFTMRKVILLKEEFWVIYDTNPQETTGFLSIVPWWTFVVVGVHLIGSIGLAVWVTRRQEKASKKSWIGMLILLVFIGISAIPMVRRNVPVVSFYNNYRKYVREKREVAQFFANRVGVNVGSYSYMEQGKKTFVVVIGESANRHHYGLYGYKRNTTPCLDSMRNELIVYQDVISPARSTMRCLAQILSYGSYEDMDLYKKEASLIEIMRDAGYKTYWLDNQGDHDKGQTSPMEYRVIVKMCDYVHVIPTIGYDEALLPFYERCLADTAENKVIFLHLYGSHFPYSKGAKEEFRVFQATDTTGIQSPYKNVMSKEDLASINMYDNSIRYNDFFVKEVLVRLQKETGMAAMLYFPDHGEEMCETFNFCGRDPAQMSRSQCEIPFVLWMNQEYKEKMELMIDTERAFCTDDVIHAIMDLTGVHHALKDTTKSVFSPMYMPKKRMVEVVMEYDSLPKWEK